MHKGTDAVGKGNQPSQKNSDSLNQRINGTNKAVKIVSEVANSSNEQSTTSKKNSKNIESISNVTHESALGIQQIAHAAEDLNRLTNNLQSLVGQFNIVQPKSEQQKKDLKELEYA